ncbi:MAG: PKD domain-containing protein, partial [Bacteroidota bacterium]
YNVGSAQVPGPNFNGNASTGGVFYEGHDFPAEYHDTYFHADYGADWIRHFTFDTNNNPTGISDFVSNGGPIVFVASNHDYDGLFYVRYPSQIRRVVYTGSDNRPPVAQLAVDRDHGPSPLGIQFTGDQSFDPEFQSLSYAWDFGDGNTSSAANPFHTFSTGGGSPAQFTVSLTVSDPQGNTDQKSQVISLNNTPPVIVSTVLGSKLLQLSRLVET